jgi:hypothetical protein
MEFIFFFKKNWVGCYNMNITFNRSVAGIIVLVMGILFILDAVLRHGLGIFVGILAIILGIYMIVASD